MLKSVMALSVAGALALAAMGAKAEEQKVGVACKDDIAKFCAAVKKGGGAIFSCLEQQQALSPACKTALDSRHTTAKKG